MKLAEILTGPETWCRWWTDRGGQARCVWAALAELHPDMLQIIQQPYDAKPCRVYNAKHPEAQRFMRLAGTNNLPTWNDAPGRTWEEVATVVDAYDRDRMLNP